MKKRTEYILEKTVDLYIESAEAIGSKRFIEGSSLECSSATIRNEMSYLVQEGFLEQVHLSSGRVPTDKGYRFYVNKVGRKKINLNQKAALQVNAHTIKDCLLELTESLCSTLKVTTLISFPSITQNVLRAIHMILIDVNRVLVLFLGALGTKDELVLTLETDVKQEDLNRLSAILSDQLKGESFTEADWESVMSILPQYKPLLDRLKKGMLNFLDGQNKKQIIQKGKSSMMTLPEFNDAGYARRVVNLLDDTIFLSKMMDKVVKKSKAQVMIGQETGSDRMENTSMVCRPCIAGEDCVGTLAFFGPSRMNYGILIPLIENIAKMVENNDALYYSDRSNGRSI